MIARDELCRYLADFLSVTDFRDYCPNGLQVEGKCDISTIVSGVTASEQLIDEAITLKADALLVHHGYFWKGEPYPITGMRKQRIAKLLKHDINLLAYHLPLDCHLTLGNNVSFTEVLPLTNVSTKAIGQTPNILWQGELDKPLSATEFADLCAKGFAQSPLHLPALDDKPIKRVAWCSGGAQDYIHDAAILGVDAYISGEASERTTHLARELNIHYFACGHHATERLGVKRLGELLAAEYGLTHHFIDIPNPV